MKVCLGSQNFDGGHQSVMTIGIFDGCHIGHQALIQKVVTQSKKLKKPSVLYTMDPHPLEVLYPEKKVKRLFPLTYMEEVGSSLGLDYLVIEKFSEEFSKISSSIFFKEYIYNIFKPDYLFVGSDFRFGWNRVGSNADLEKWKTLYHFQLHVCPPVLLGDQVVSSSLMRKAFEEFDFNFLSKILGRSFYMKGDVVSGRGMGQKIGFPTVNVHVTSQPCPQYGVYVCKMKMDNHCYLGVMNWGSSPTFGGEERLEVHVLDYNKEPLQGQRVSIEPLHRIRSAKKFDKIPQLTQAIQQDVRVAQQYFSRYMGS